MARTSSDRHPATKTAALHISYEDGEHAVAYARLTRATSDCRKSRVLRKQAPTGQIFIQADKIGRGEAITMSSAFNFFHNIFTIFLHTLISFTANFWSIATIKIRGCISAIASARFGIVRIGADCSHA